ncbi:replication initiation protein [Staphylococcus epidermidis]|nr:replication initiation protein [Staphylococcus epidermidis]
MSKNNQANHSSHLENHDLDNFSKTGYSNSRLNRVLIEIYSLVLCISRIIKYAI